MDGACSHYRCYVHYGANHDHGVDITQQAVFMNQLMRDMGSLRYTRGGPLVVVLGLPHVLGPSVVERVDHGS